MIFAKIASLLLLLVLCISAPQSRAQNQTSANVPSVGWTDPDTGLTWTKTDNRSDVNWNQANAYCSNLRLGGFSDWRLPTIDELEGIYDPSIDVPGRFADGDAVTFHVKGNLKLSGGQWSSSLKQAGEAWGFGFNFGHRFSNSLSYGRDSRALCVRR
jgi:hypothetical protein